MKNAAAKSLQKISEVLRTDPTDEFTSSDMHIAWLHSVSFHENSANLIRAIEFVDSLRVRLDTVRVNSSNADLMKLYPLHIAIDHALSDLYEFADGLRGG